MKRVLYFVSLVTLTTMFSCNKAENSSLVQADVVSAPLSLVTKAYGSTAMACSCSITDPTISAGDRPRDAGSITGGFTITYDDVLNW